MDPEFKVMSLSILFDLGGVLVELLEERTLMELCPHLNNRNEVHDAWVASPAVKAFETGKIGFDEFCTSAMEDLKVETDVETFRNAHAKFLGNPFPGAEDLVKELRRNFTVTCLSNTNVEHIRGLRERSSLLNHFHHCFLSYETGLVKPDREAFLNVGTTLGMKLEEILFIDDKWQNVEAARNVGMQGFVAGNLPSIRKELISRQILGSA